MHDLIATRPVIPAMSAKAIRAVRALEERVLALPQVPIETRHVLHAGMYARTICVPAGVLITGAHITIPTLLIVSGHATLFIGEEDVAKVIADFRTFLASLPSGGAG